MRFLILNYMIKYFSGSEINALQLCSALRNLGHDAEIGTFVSDDPLRRVVEEQGIRVIDLFSEQNNLEYDVIWAHHAPVLSYLLFEKKLSNCKILFSSLGPIVSLEAPPLFHSAIGLHLANSKACKQVMEDFGVRTESITIFPNYAPELYFNYPRKIMPDYPKRIAVISNHPPQELRLFAKNIAKDRGDEVTVDFIGINDNVKFVNETLLNQYDLIISIGKTVFYCFALSIPVYCYDHFGGPGYISEDNFEIAKDNNFSGRGFNRKLTPNELIGHIFGGYTEAIENLDFLQKKAYNEFCLEKNLSSLLAQIERLEITNIVDFRRENKLANKAYAIFSEIIQETKAKSEAEKEQAIQSLNSQLAEKDQSIQMLNTEINSLNIELVNYEMSHSWRITRPFRKIVTKLRRIIK